MEVVIMATVEADMTAIGPDVLPTPAAPEV